MLKVVPYRLSIGMLALKYLCFHLKLKRVRFANKDALKEIHRVLQPGGVFGMIWNVEDCSWTP